MIKILIFATMPPPIGGVSVHIERFLHFSKDYQDKVNIDVYDIKKRKLNGINSEKKGILILFYSFLSADIIHIHISNNFKILIALIAKLFRKRVVYTHHNSRVNHPKIFKYMTQLSDKIILVNDKEIDLKLLDRKKIEHIPAFLPPYEFKELPTFLNEKIEESTFVISTNCFKYTLLNNKDLYGFDLIIEAYSSFITSPNIKNTLLIIVDPSGTTQEYVASCIKKYPLINENNFLYVSEKIDFVSLVRKSHLTIRATRSDGDSLSVRESLYLGIPIIASDVTYRPKGTILFQNENVKSLEEEILKVYSHQTVISEQDNQNFATKIIALYQKIKN